MRYLYFKCNFILKSMCMKCSFMSWEEFPHSVKWTVSKPSRLDTRKMHSHKLNIGSWKKTHHKQTNIQHTVSYIKKGKGELSMVLNIAWILLMLCFVLMYHGYAFDFVLLFNVTASKHELISYDDKGIDFWLVSLWLGYCDVPMINLSVILIPN